MSPTETLRFRGYFGSIPLEADRIELHLKTSDGEPIGLLDALDIL